MTPDPEPEPRHLALVGLTGVGKSTLAAALTRALAAHEQRGIVVKLAAPLYRLQRAVHCEAGLDPLTTGQDQQLLADLAGHLRRLNPVALTEAFLAEIATYPEDVVVVNDDVRDVGDAERLRAAGFDLVRLTCPESVRHARLGNRADASLINEKELFGPALEAMPVERILDTRAPVGELAEQLLTTLGGGARRAHA